MATETYKAAVERIAALRRQRWTGDQIAKEVGVSPATVSRVLKQPGLSKLKALAPAEPVRRGACPRAACGRPLGARHPGELIHIDIKKLGRFEKIGHRITGERAGQSSSRSVGWEFVHVCLDDASAHRLRPGSARRAQGERHRLPASNGKAERFIQSALGEWAYAQAYPTSAHRTAQLPAWLHRYNWHRPHGGIKSQTPINRLALSEDNLLRLHS